MQLPAPLLKGDRVENADYRDALLVNMIAVKRDIKGANGYIITHPGLIEFAAGFGADRGAVWNERILEHFRVSGGRFIQVDSDGAVTDLGGVAGSGQASMAQSFNTQAVVAGGNYYLYDESNGLRQITDSNVGNPIDITWIDGYYFFTDGENLYHTDIADEEAIDPLNFATSEFSPDPTLGVAKTQDNQVVVFNRYTTEYFINRATDNFAFQRVAGKAVKSGIVGTHCKTEMDGLFFILGGGKKEAPSVHVITPGRAQSVATREIDQIIRKYSETELTETVMESRTDKRDMLVIIHLPEETLIYNHTIAQAFGLEQAWSIVKTGNADAAWRGKNGVFDPRVTGGEAWIYGDRTESNIGQLSDTVSTTYGEQNEFIFYAPFFMLDGFSIDQIEVQTIPGFTDENATVAFSRTENGLVYGREWWNLYSTSLDYSQRFEIRRIGYVRNYLGVKFRAVTAARMAFSSMVVTYG